MRVVVIGAGGVGTAVTAIAARRGFVESMVVADYDLARAERAVAATGSDRFRPARIDASDTAAVTELVKAANADAVLNACDPRFVMPIFEAVAGAGAAYLDMAMSLSRPQP
jgi:saccharopine dehydrogenase (NAD+, L-lysine forming)